MILIALGANLPSRCGPPGKTFAAARRALERRGVKVTKTSGNWLTRPVPDTGQDWYTNAVIAVETGLGMRELLGVLKETEREFGRTDHRKNAPRSLDLDLIAYHGEVYEGEDLSVPHPRAHGRGFVLYPLQEVKRHWIHPVLRRSVSDLISDLPENQVVKRLKKEAA